MLVCLLIQDGIGPFLYTALVSRGKVSCWLSDPALTDLMVDIFVQKTLHAIVKN